MQQLKRLRIVYGTVFKDATLIATVDNQIISKLPEDPECEEAATGTWEQGRGGGYSLSLTDGAHGSKL